MTNADFDRVLHLIGLIYDAATQPDLWPKFFLQLCEVIPSTNGNIHTIDTTTGRGIVSFSRTPPEMMQLYFERYHEINPYFQRDLPLMRTGFIRRS